MRHWSYSRFSRKGDAPGQEHSMDKILTHSWQPPGWAGAPVLSKTSRSPPISTSFHVFSYFSCLCTCFHTPMIKIHPSFCFCPWLSKTFVSPHIAVEAYPRPLTSLWSQGTLRISCVSNSDSYIILNQCQSLCTKTSKGLGCTQPSYR